MELDSRKKSSRDRMMRSNSFETQEVRKTDWKEARKSRGFPLWMEILRMRIIEGLFQMEEKEC